MTTPRKDQVFRVTKEQLKQPELFKLLVQVADARQVEFSTVYTVVWKPDESMIDDVLLDVVSRELAIWESRALAIDELLRSL